MPLAPYSPHVAVDDRYDLTVTWDAPVLTLRAKVEWQVTADPAALVPWAVDRIQAAHVYCAGGDAPPGFGEVDDDEPAGATHALFVPARVPDEVWVEPRPAHPDGDLRHVVVADVCARWVG